jgi:hypothetical protein
MSKTLSVSRKAVTKRPRGASRKQFAHDSERYAISRADAYIALGVSENDAFMTVAVQMLGAVVASENVGPRRKRGRGLVPAGTLVTYERRVTGGGSAATFAGKATTLRLKARGAEQDPQAVAWRTAIGRCYVLAFTAKDHTISASIIWELASLVGEEAQPRDVLLPLLEAHFMVARFIHER